jgi:hypothetical protein
MFERLAKFRLLWSRGPAPGPLDVAPANDNLLNFGKPGERRRRAARPALACRWSLLDGGTRLGCRWQAETPAQAAVEDSDSGLTVKQICPPQGTRCRRTLQNLTLMVRG